MNILVLNGSPRQNGNTAKMVTAFCEGAESSNHTVKTVNVCKLNVKGCLACEYRHSKGNGKCIQKDDMQYIYLLLNDTNMLVLASPIYYHGISGQLKCVIDRFYSALYPVAPKSLTKIAMFLSSSDRNQYDVLRAIYIVPFLETRWNADSSTFAIAASKQASIFSFSSPIIPSTIKESRQWPAQ